MSNILTKNLAESPASTTKKAFAMIGISPFNSYFSAEKILQICEWINNEYEEFAIFIPTQISKYTLQALGYTEARIYQKVRKQDNYTLSKTKKALAAFYSKYPDNNEVKIHTIATLREQQAFQDLYKSYSELFNNDPEFRQGCLNTSEWVLLSSGNPKNITIEDSQKNLAVQYFLTELPLMLNVPKILAVDSCDFVYQVIPEFLQQLYQQKELVSDKQRFLILGG